MLNYNVNYIEPFANKRNFLKGKLDWTWQRAISTAAGIQSGSIIFGSGSILYVPYAPTTLYVSGTYEQGPLGSGSAIGQPVTISVTGSGVWPVTGSNQFYILIGSNLGFNQNTTLTLSAAAGNMNLSGSKISSSFTPVGKNEYNVNFGLTHTKGNIYNPLVNVKVQNTSPTSTTGNVNGHTASFNMVKDVNVSLYSLSQVTGSYTSSFQYAYNFGVTSSLTASIQANATGSTTMSIDIPEAGISTSSYYFNPTSAGTKILTGSFAAGTDNPYNVTASVTFNKGNTSNSKISYFTSASHVSNINLTSSFNIVKNVSESIVSVPFLDGIITGSTTNNYAFNITASLTSSWEMGFSSASQLYYFGKTIYSASQLGYFTSSFSSASIISSSFAATTGIADYQFTASVKEIALAAFSASFILIGGGGGGSVAGTYGGLGGPGAGGGAGGWTKIDLPVIPLKEYKLVTAGAGGAAGINQVPIATYWNGFAGSGSILSYWSGTQYVTASVNGGGGGNYTGVGGVSGNGKNGSGGGGGGTVSGSTGGNGGIYLGGAQGVAGTVYRPNNNPPDIQPPFATGSAAPTINLPVPNQIYTASMSGSGGNGGWYGPNGSPRFSATSGSFGGGGGGGENGGGSTSAAGKAGGDGALIIIYQGAPKLTIEGGYTNYVVNSISGSDYTVHYVTASNSTITYGYES